MQVVVPPRNGSPALRIAARVGAFSLALLSCGPETDERGAFDGAGAGGADAATDVRRPPDAGVAEAGSPGLDAGTDVAVDVRVCDSDVGSGHSLKGTLSYLDDDTFTVTSPYSGIARLELEGYGCPLVRVVYDSDASPTFTIAGLASGQNWLRRTQLSGGREVLPTISPVVTDSDPVDVDFSFVPTSLLDAIVASAGVGRDPARAQIVVHVATRGPFGVGPAPGVSVSVQGAAAVLYNTGSGWSASQGATGYDGFAVVLDVPAAEYPGRELPVRIAGSNVTAVAAAGAVTFFVVLLS